MAGLGNLLATHIPALIVMIVGYILLVVEMYIPGFGLAGISGVVLITAGIALMQPTALQALILIVITAALLAVALAIAMRTLSKGRLSRSKLVLNDQVSGTPGEAGEDGGKYIGREGVAHTALRPAGIAEFGDVRLNVVSDGAFIEQGRTVRVERVEGGRVVVRESGAPAA